jgi:hypothetical protein
MSNTTSIDRLFSAPRLWLGESIEEFERLHAELEQEIKPQGFIEKLYVNNMALLVWDILRQRRMKTDFILTARPAALLTILKQILFRLNSPLDEGIRARSLVRAWFEDGAEKKEVQELLQKFQLDESAIDAEAYRSVFSEVQEINKTLAVAEALFSKTIRFISDYRKSFALQVQSSTEQILSRDDVPRLELASDDGGPDRLDGAARRSAG